MTNPDIKPCPLCQSQAQRLLFVQHGYQLVRCSNCELAFIANPPDEKAVRALYTSEGSGAYHQDVRSPDSRAARRMMQTAHRHLQFLTSVVRQGRLLDVGCSTGDFLSLAVAAGFDAHGVELSQASVRIAVEQRGLSAQQGSVDDLDPQAAMDVITAFDVLEHIPDPIRELRAYVARLKPGGWLVISTPNIDGLFPRLSYKVAKFLGYWPHPEPPHHLYQFGEATLRRILADQGLVPGRARHAAIDFSYSFGRWPTLMRMPKRLLYALAFGPVSMAGPWLGQGDWIYMAARKPG